ncbi:extracellular catalytic domain type 1 short-chain-length polyhydroxyalkanoate depolymerase [Bacillus benzoevorans]|uniref:Poly(Hydroxyalkanoate) depolymerase family esterase n=1 Tax=Bacillus benzoevorans TaxID=1456 RepID=A0A7X0HPS6_9BACI|nr:PHB depolymerase family esterase [Bacillus benzoevorans]MBB6444481.1 poly(hydroxyalkanoate) depolymerase family esterase [Bacillus benzoevorans]
MGEFLGFAYQDFKYKLYIPGEYQVDKECPLVVLLHGCSQNPDDFAAGTNMNTLAEKEQFFVLYPDMNHPFNPADPAGYNHFGCWNWFLDKNQHRGQGHPKLIYGMINEVKSKYMIDSKKVYAAGFSAGGSQACILGAAYPDVFNGIGIYSGLAYDAANVLLLIDPLANEAQKRMATGVPDPFECGNHAFQEMGENKKKMRVIVFHGSSDTTVNPINGEQVIIQWAQTNFLVEGGIGQADVTPAQIHSDSINGKSYICYVYHDSNDKELLEFWLIDEMGHAWSGGTETGSYTDPSGPNATEIMWEFLSKHPQQHVEKRSETQVIERTPVFVESQLHPLESLPVVIPVEQPPVNDFVNPPENPPAPTPPEPAVEIPLETPDKTSTEIKGERMDESPGKTSIKDFVKAILVKLMKRKNKTKK